MDLSKLKAPFRSDEIEWRVMQAGKTPKGVWARVVAYVQARAIRDRLDEVFTPAGWSVRYRFEEKGTVAIIGIRVGVGDLWVEKEDGAEATDIEPFKGGISGAFKRAACVWGIGRYLYKLEEGFAQIVSQGTKGAYYGKTREGEPFYWVPPELPDWALPKDSPVTAEVQKQPTAKPVETGEKRHSVSPSSISTGTLSEEELADLASFSDKCGWSLSQVIAYSKRRYGKTPRTMKKSDVDELRRQMSLMDYKTADAEFDLRSMDPDTGNE